MEAFLLGLANGTVCLAFCAPVLIPFLLAEGKTTPANFGLMGEFLLGRLVGYLGFGAIAWITNSLILAKTSFREMVMGGVYMILAVFLVAFSLRPEHKPCGGQWLTRQSGRFHSDISQWFSLVLGLLTGLNLCPPFLLAFAGAAGSGSLGSSVFLLLMFFSWDLALFPASAFYRPGEPAPDSSLGGAAFRRSGGRLLFLCRINHVWRRMVLVTSQPEIKSNFQTQQIGVVRALLCSLPMFLLTAFMSLGAAFPIVPANGWLWERLWYLLTFYFF